jgi:hypothetical protein
MTTIEEALKSLHDNQIALRGQLIGMMAAQQALLEQLEGKDIIDFARWNRDKIRITAQYEQKVSALDEERRAERVQEKFEPRVAIGDGNAVMRFHLSEAPLDDEQLTVAVEFCSHPNLNSNNPRRDHCPDCGYEFQYGDVRSPRADVRRSGVINPGRDRDALERAKNQTPEERRGE